MSVDTTGKIPFAYPPGNEIGHGTESIVRELGPDWVLKEVNPVNEYGQLREQERKKDLRSPERVAKISKEQQILENIFGKEHFLRSYFILGEDEKGNRGYMNIQRRINGSSIKNIVEDGTMPKKELIYQNREQLMEIVWGAKKAFIELGVPIDFHDDNIVLEETTGRIVLIDSGFPSEESGIVFGSEQSNRKVTSIIRAYRRIDELQRYEKSLQLTEQEKELMDNKYGITDEEFLKQQEKLNLATKQAGISDEELERERRKVTLDGFFDEVFGEKERVTGSEIREHALGIIKNNTTDISKRTRRILDTLEQQGDVLESRDYWRTVIEQ